MAEKDKVVIEPLFCNDTLLLNSMFAEESGLVAKTLCDERFKIFSRRYILNNILRDLDENPNESDYLKYFEYLCCLENYPEKTIDTENTTNLIVSLLNAWYLFKARNIIDDQNKPILTPERKILSHNNRNLCSNNYASERKRIIELLLFNVTVEEQYAQHIVELYSMEQSRDDIIGYW